MYSLMQPNINDNQMIFGVYPLPHSISITILAIAEIGLRYFPIKSDYQVARLKSGGRRCYIDFY